MTRRIVLISGPVSSGKSKLAQLLSERFAVQLLKTRVVIEDLAGLSSPGRLALQMAGDELDLATDHKWLAEALTAFVVDKPEDTLIAVDSVRTAKQVEHIRNAFGSSITHIHVTASPETLADRYSKREKKEDNPPSYEIVKSNTTESKIEDLADLADAVIITDRNTLEDVLVRAATQLGLYRANADRLVDVIIGGQYGSEGKGNMVAYLAKEYDLLVRVGGPNAGHKVFEEPEPFTHHHLPSGTRKSSAKLLPTPGMVINVNDLLHEISQCHVDESRLAIDPQAMIISDEDIAAERKLVEVISSTGQGVGAATARKIMGRSETMTLLARDISDLKPYTRRTAQEVLAETLSKGGKVLVEGTQGTALSLYHGSYPYVTSRDTTVSGCLAEAGIAATRVRRVIMVCRTYPIRVKNAARGKSGPLSMEIDLTEISRRSGKNLEELQKTEITSTTRHERRIGEFDWDLLHRASFLNAPTDIALTFVDYPTRRTRWRSGSISYPHPQ